MLQAIAASVDYRYPDVDHLIELAVKRASHAGVKRSEVLQHLGAVSEQLLHVAGLALQLLFVDFFNFRGSLIGFDGNNSCHESSV